MAKSCDHYVVISAGGATIEPAEGIDGGRHAGDVHFAGYGCNRSRHKSRGDARRDGTDARHRVAERTERGCAGRRELLAEADGGNDGGFDVAWKSRGPKPCIQLERKSRGCIEMLAEALGDRHAPLMERKHERATHRAVG